eukprot:170957-Chlamydomonas_euryale.AAC.5
MSMNEDRQLNMQQVMKKREHRCRGIPGSLLGKCGAHEMDSYLVGTATSGCTQLQHIPMLQLVQRCYQLDPYIKRRRAGLTREQATCLPMQGNQENTLVAPFSCVGRHANMGRKPIAHRHHPQGICRTVSIQLNHIDL